MKILFPLGLAWLAGVLTVIAFFMSTSVDFEDVDDDIFEQDDEEDKNE